MENILRFNSLSEFHKLCNLPKPKHPLVSLADYGLVEFQTDDEEVSWLQNFYCIGLKRDIQGKFRYGQQSYDFDEGILAFTAPGQKVQMKIIKQDKKPSGWMLLIHPDFLWNTDLAKHIKHYEFFGYSTNEALFLAEDEEEIVIDIFRQIEKEYNKGIDRFTQKIIVAQIEVLLNYFERFYQRQFITRQKSNHQILEKVEWILDECFKGNNLVEAGLPTAQSIAMQLNVSPNYLGSLLKSLTGQTTQQHIHGKLIEKAKEKLSTTTLTVSEIAYGFGFEYPQSFSKLFKQKTNQSPVEFRASFANF